MASAKTQRPSKAQLRGLSRKLLLRFTQTSFGLNSLAPKTFEEERMAGKEGEGHGTLTAKGTDLSLDSSFCGDLTRASIAGTDVPIFYVVVAIPTLLFALYLLFHLRGSIRKLRESESLIMSTYYGFCLGVLAFNIGRIIWSLTFPTWDPSGLSYDIISIVINFVLIFVEVSVLIFLSENYAISGREAIPKTVWISVFIALIYAGVQVGWR